MTEYKIVPIIPTDEMVDVAIHAKDLVFDMVFLDDYLSVDEAKATAKRLIKSAIEAVPPTNLIAVDKGDFNALLDALKPFLDKIKYPHTLKNYSELVEAVKNGVTDFDAEVHPDSDSYSIELENCCLKDGRIYADLHFSFSMMGGESGGGCYYDYLVPEDLIIDEKGGYTKDNSIRGKVEYEDHTSLDSYVGFSQRDLHNLKAALTPFGGDNDKP